MNKELQKNKNYQDILDNADELYVQGNFTQALALLDKIPQDCDDL